MTFLRILMEFIWIVHKYLVTDPIQSNSMVLNARSKLFPSSDQGP